MADHIADNVLELYEIDPSTRSSTTLWTKHSPVDVTLTTAGTAQNLISISANPASPTVNLATNPSFETGAPPTGYTATGATLTQSAVVARNATNSMLINPDNLAAGEGAFWTADFNLGSTGENKGLHLVASAYFRDNAASGNNARLLIADSTGVTLATGNTVTFSDAATWYRSFISYPLVQTGAIYRVYFVTVTNHNTNFYVDSFQAEISRNSTPTDYTDGSLGINYEWFGTANASMSRRRAGLVAIRGFNLHTTRDVYISYDHTASSTTGVFRRAGTDWSIDHPVNIMRNISFVNVNVGELPRVYGEIWGVHQLKMNS